MLLVQKVHSADECTSQAPQTQALAHDLEVPTGPAPYSCLTERRGKKQLVDNKMDSMFRGSKVDNYFKAGFELRVVEGLGYRVWGLRFRV